MKKLLIFFLGLSMLLTACAQGPTHPTEEEWVEVYLSHRLHEWYDQYAIRMVIRVEIHESYGYPLILVAMTPANNLVVPSEDYAEYQEDLEGMVEIILEDMQGDFEWIEDYEVEVYFL